MAGNNYFLIFAIFISLLLHKNAFAEESQPDAPQLFDLSLAQLATISVASKREETISEAPAIVSVVTAQDIKKYGYRNLRDILDRQTHLQIIGSNFLPHNKAVIRGVSNSHVDNNVLLQLNGRPIRDAAISSANLDIYELFPVHAIKKIEIIRGPGSVLYGTNAFSGVINIVTYNKDKTPATVTARIGDFNTKAFAASGSWHDRGITAYGALNYQEKDGDTFANITDQFGQQGDYPTGTDGVQALANLAYKGFHLNSLYSNSTNDTVRSIFAFPATTAERERKFIDAGYTHSFNESWSLESNITVSEIRSKAVALPEPTPPPTTVVAKNHLLETTVKGKVTEKINLLIGAVAEASQERGVNEYNSLSRSTYVQLDYQTNNWLKLIAGTQYHIPDQADESFSPRLGAIVKLSRNWTTKLLYSEAFREASPLERFINIPAIMGDPALEPETIETLDLQFSYQNKANQFSLTLFNSKQQSIITRVPGPPILVINAGSIEYQGFELEASSQLTKRLSVTSNASYQINKSDDGTRGVTFAPKYTFKTGANYTFSNHTTAGIFISYFGESSLQNESAANPVNSDADDYLLVTANLNGNLGKLLSNSKLNPYEVTLYADNLLNEPIYFPSINRTEVNSLPHHSGRGFYLSLTANF